VNPYLTLGVAPGADDQQIRRAYLAAIKEATPDTQPDRFKEISQAYEAIKDESRRLNFYLFNTHSSANSPLDALLQYLRARSQFKPLPFENMKEFLRLCSKT
jgi:curved DNA-binding protein CbpA